MVTEADAGVTRRATTPVPGGATYVGLGCGVVAEGCVGAGLVARTDGAGEKKSTAGVSSGMSGGVSSGTSTEKVVHGTALLMSPPGLRPFREAFDRMFMARAAA